jgi:copper oxidase (laccase) domain-containing protein
MASTPASPDAVADDAVAAGAAARARAARAASAQCLGVLLRNEEMTDIGALHPEV